MEYFTKLMKFYLLVFFPIITMKFQSKTPCYNFVFFLQIHSNANINQTNYITNKIYVVIIIILTYMGGRGY